MNTVQELNIKIWMEHC